MLGPTKASPLTASILFLPPHASPQLHLIPATPSPQQKPPPSPHPISSYSESPGVSQTRSRRHQVWVRGVRSLCPHLLSRGSPGQLAAHLVARGLDSRVVLDLPQPLAEPFPLVGLAKLLLGLLVREEVFGAQECPGERWETVLSSPSLPLSCTAQQGRGTITTHFPNVDCPQPSPPQPRHSRLMGPEKKHLIFVGR